MAIESSENYAIFPAAMPSKAHHPPPNPRRFSEAEPEEYGRSRTSLKKERVNNELALAELADLLLTLNPASWPALGVSEAACEALRSAQLIKSFAAKNRQLRLVRARLRDLDWMSIRAAIDRKRAGFAAVVPAQEDEEARVWTEQLLVQKDDGLGRFVTRFEAPNRQRLRQLVRNVLQAGEAKRHRARQSLLDAVREVIAGAATSVSTEDDGASLEAAEP